jgi:hypothetical protein
LKVAEVTAATRKLAELNWAERPEESMDNGLSELSQLSDKLNQKSDKLNSAISAVNAKLGKLKLGIEVWLESPLLEVGGHQDVTGFDGKHLGGYRPVKLLGYARVGRKWQLAVRQARMLTETGELVDELEYPDTSVQNVQEPYPVPPCPLLDASRQARSDAMALVPHLIALLKQCAESLLGAVEAAEKAAQQL